MRSHRLTAVIILSCALLLAPFLAGAAASSDDSRPRVECDNCDRHRHDADWEEFHRAMERLAEEMGELGIDVGLTVAEAMQAVDWEEIGETIGDSMVAIDWDEIGETIERSIEAVDWDEIDRSVERSMDRRDWERFGRDLERTIERSLRGLDDLEIEVDLSELERSLERLERRLERLDDSR